MSGDAGAFPRCVVKTLMTPDLTALLLRSTWSTIECSHPAAWTASWNLLVVCRVNPFPIRLTNSVPGVELL